jgi:PTH1 family peptidyl-tRNA hydrolase
MNLSGVPVRNLMEKRIRPDHVIVIHDELDIDLGQLRIKFGGGDNGHNGLRSIRSHVGTGDYFRVRVGIGRPAVRMEVTDWVLTNFRTNERDEVIRMVDLAADAVESLVTSGLEKTQARYNS